MARVFQAFSKFCSLVSLNSSKSVDVNNLMFNFSQDDTYSTDLIVNLIRTFQLESITHFTIAITVP